MAVAAEEVEVEAGTMSNEVEEVAVTVAMTVTDEEGDGVALVIETVTEIAIGEMIVIETVAIEMVTTGTAAGTTVIETAIETAIDEMAIDEMAIETETEIAGTTETETVTGIEGVQHPWQTNSGLTEVSQLTWAPVVLLMQVLPRPLLMRRRRLLHLVTMKVADVSVNPSGAMSSKGSPIGSATSSRRQSRHRSRR